MTSRSLLIVETPGNESGRFRALARRAGFRVLTTNSGPMTPAVVRRTQPTIVLLSPHTDSPGPSEIARNIKEDPTVCDVPVLMLLHDERAAQHAYPTEAFAYLTTSDDELLRTMELLAKNSRRVSYTPKPTGPLEGSLDSDSLPDVLQFLFAARKTGRVTVQNGAREPGRIYIESGNVVHAEHAERNGVEAFRHLCFATYGRFRFEPEARTAHRTMLEGGMEILLEAARSKDVAGRMPPSMKGKRASRRQSYANAVGSSLPSLSQPEPKRAKPFAGLLNRITRAFS